MQRRTLIAAATGLGFSVRARAQPAAEIGAEAARRDLRILKRAFTELHPGLYRYATPAQIDADFATADAALAAGSSRGELFLLASRLAAAVHCGHTWTNPSNQGAAVAEGLFARADKLPLTLRWLQGRALVTGSVAPAVAAGAELLAIDGRPVAGIAGELLPLLRADGLHNAGKQRSQLDSGANGGAMDRLFPLRFAPRDGRWRLTLRDAGGMRDVDVPAVRLAERDRGLPAPATDWSLKIEGDTGVLTLPTFAFWRSGFKPLEFLETAFKALRGVPFLIIDQRCNEGGDDTIGRALLAHLLRAPFTAPASRVESAYERVPYVLARYLDTWDFGFFDRTGKVTRGAGRNWRLPDAPARRIDPVTAPYNGRTVVLVGPQNSSAGYLLARDLKAAAAATLLGQRTGGNLRGLNGGELAWVTLPASGVAVDIPLLAAIAEGDPPDGGVEPDIEVVPLFDDARVGTDTEMVAARALVARWRATN